MYFDLITTKYSMPRAATACLFIVRFRVFKIWTQYSVPSQYGYLQFTKKCTNDVCGTRRVGGQRRKGSEWWNEEVGRAVAEKRRAFEQWLPMTDTGHREWL